MPKTLSLILVISCGSTSTPPARGTNTDSETTSEPAPVSASAVVISDEPVSAHDEPVSAHDEPDSGPEATERRADVVRECAPTPWGGWDGTAACRVAARRVVRGAHRRCEVDADCTLVRDGCVPHAVDRRHMSRYDAWEGPCVGPGAGPCGGPRAATCAGGCCEPVHEGLNVTSRNH